MPFQTLSEDEAVQQIVETVQLADPGDAPFALVVGSGFSHGLVPTAKQLVETSLPIWMRSLRGNGTYRELSSLPESEGHAIAREFWQKFNERNSRRGLKLDLNANTGLPNNISAAYKAAFDSQYVGAVGEPAQARRFQRALMRLDQPRLNAAHFLLASLLGVQPGLNRKNDLFQARAALCRLILTTNFDPFLQIALQAVNRLYFMSDTPELGVGDEILDQQADAIHLVYLHGSIHRRLQAASEADINEIRAKNARILAEVLERRGVIVLGYSGWDDAIVEALAECDHFDHRLYWCGREADPLARDAFGPNVPKILCKSTASYVQIGGAGYFMARLYTQLVQGLPRLLDNPIGQVREMLQTIDLTELKSIAAQPAGGPPGPAGVPDADAFVGAQQAAIERLNRMEQSFLSFTASAAAAPAADAAAANRPAAPTPAPAADAASAAQYLLSGARVASALRNYKESLKLFTQALDLDTLQPTERAAALLERGVDFYSSGEIDRAQMDWTTVINLPGAPIEHVVQAHINRGYAWGQKGDMDSEVADYGVVIDEMKGVPLELLASALHNRGNALERKGNTDAALADHTRVIEKLPGISVEQVARALAARGWDHFRRGDYAASVADTEAALAKFPALPQAAFNLGLALLASKRDVDAYAAYQRAAEQFPSEVETALPDLKSAQQSWLPAERAAPILQLLSSHVAHTAAAGT